MTELVQFITSRDNPKVKALRQLTKSTAYRAQGRLWLEGDHLCRAALSRGWSVELAVFSDADWPHAASSWPLLDVPVLVLADTLMQGLSSLPSAQPMGFVVALPLHAKVDTLAPTVVLDRIQDAGNVGSILRSAAAFGYLQILAREGTASLWSPKVLRAGMGAHFGLRLIEGVDLSVIQSLEVPLLATNVHVGETLHHCVGPKALPWPCAWLMGHEGQGLDPAWQNLAHRCVRIAQPGGEESLNVAAAAAICLHASRFAGERVPGYG